MKTHGATGTTEYQCWALIKGRCLNPKNPCFKDYGGRGIGMCEKWQSSFPSFLRDMGKRPAGGEIERINNDGDYEPGNCRWATHQEQCWNRRSNRIIDHNGQSLPFTEWARRYGIPKTTLHSRLKRGIPFSEAIEHPTNPHS